MSYYADVTLSLIDLPPRLMRKETALLNLGALIESIRRRGLLQPICVRDMENGRYELMAGYRRLCACLEMGKLAISARIFAIGEVDPDEVMGEENFNREQVNEVEEAEFFAHQAQKHNISLSEVARRYHCSDGYVRQLVGLLGGDEEVLEAMREGKLTKSQAGEINKFQDEIGRRQALKYALDNGMTAVSIKAWRESRERGGVSDAMKQVKVILDENQAMMVQTNLLCQFHKQYLPLDRVQTLQICDECFSGLAEALEFWTRHGHNQDPPPEAA